MGEERPIAFLLTWPTYGTWLPGDGRGWVEYRQGFRLPNRPLESLSAARMTEDACRLAAHQRERVHEQVAETCRYREWVLHAVNCRSNHVHVVVSATEAPEIVREQLKAWCTRRLKEQEAERGVQESERRKQWWAERGSARWIFRESELAEAVEYVMNEQDESGRYWEPDA